MKASMTAAIIVVVMVVCAAYAALPLISKIAEIQTGK